MYNVYETSKKHFEILDLYKIIDDNKLEYLSCRLQLSEFVWTQCS